MKPATLQELKAELRQLDQEEILQLCLQLGRFKKENKELLTYLLFDAKDEQTYREEIKLEIDSEVEELNTGSVYHAKKGLQKINRTLTKYIRYSRNKQTEAEVLMHFAKAIRKTPAAVQRNPVINNLYNRLIVKINKALATLHEDLQADYQYELDQING